MQRNFKIEKNFLILIIAKKYRFEKIFIFKYLNKCKETPKEILKLKSFIITIWIFFSYFNKCKEISEEISKLKRFFLILVIAKKFLKKFLFGKFVFLYLNKCKEIHK